MKGKVFFVGAGPGSVDLLTLRAVRVLQRADVVLHDDLVPQEILDLAPERAEVRSVGKRCGKPGTTQAEVNALLIDYARAGKSVVRLKCGDPSLFGRLGEEMDALREAAVEFEIVPGVTAALAAAADAQISLTDRRVASRVVFAAASLAHGGRQDWSTILAPHTTVVVYMPGPDYGRLAAELLEAGAAPGLPCAVVARAGEKDGSLEVGTVGELSQVQAATPALVIVGEVLGARRTAQARSEVERPKPVVAMGAAARTETPVRAAGKRHVAPSCPGQPRPTIADRGGRAPLAGQQEVNAGARVGN